MVFTRVSTCNYHGASLKNVVKYCNVCEKYSARLTVVLSKMKLFRAQKKDTHRSESFLAYMIIIYSIGCVYWHFLLHTQLFRRQSKLECKNVKSEYLISVVIDGCACLYYVMFLSRAQVDG